MKCVREQTIERIIEGEELRLEGLDINGREYSLNITSGKDGGISLDFNKDKHPDSYSVPEYKIAIDKKGIRFERFVRRTGHDHDDTESLQVVVDPERAHGKKGDLVWRSRFPYKGEGYDFFYIPFNGIELKY